MLLENSNPEEQTIVAGALWRITESSFKNMLFSILLSAVSQ